MIVMVETASYEAWQTVAVCGNVLYIEHLKYRITRRQHSHMCLTLTVTDFCFIFSRNERQTPSNNIFNCCSLHSNITGTREMFDCEQCECFICALCIKDATTIACHTQKYTFRGREVVLMQVTSFMFRMVQKATILFPSRGWNTAIITY